MPRTGRAGAGYEALATELKKGTLHPAYLIWGEERFLVARSEEEIVRKALDGESTDSFNLARYDSLGSSLGEAIASANELPMLKARRVVVFRGITVRDAQGNAKVPVKKSERDALRSYLEAPNPSTVLVLTGEVADQRQRFLTGAKNLRVFEMRSPAPQRLLRWIAGKASSCGFTVSPEAAAELVERVGTSMTALSVEIEKLSLFVDEGATCDAEAVAALSEGGSGVSAYEVSDALARGDSAAAVRAMRRVIELFTDGETRMLSELRRSLSLWLRIRQAIERGEGPGSLPSSLGLPPFVVRKNVDAARRHSLPALVDLVSHVTEIERTLKLGGGGVSARIELLVLRVAGGDLTPSGAGATLR